MNDDNFNEAWDKHKETFLELHPQLSHDDIICKFGEEEQMLERIQKKLGKTKEEIRNWLRIMG